MSGSTSFGGNPRYECHEKKDLSQSCDEFCAELTYRTGIRDAVPHLDNNWNWILARLDASTNGCLPCPTRSDRLGNWAKYREDTCYSPLECIYYHNPGYSDHRRRNKDKKPTCAPTCLAKASAVTRENNLATSSESYAYGWNELMPDVVVIDTVESEKGTHRRRGANRYYKSNEVNNNIRFTCEETAAYHTCTAHYHDLDR